MCGRSKNVGMPMAMLLHTDHNHERPGGARVFKVILQCMCKDFYVDFICHTAGIGRDGIVNLKARLPIKV